jgi:hypothetical protein
MKEIRRMRLGVLKEIKNVRKFFDHMEHNVKCGNHDATEKAYMFLSNMVLLMNEGSLTPDSIAIDVELAKEFHDME